MIRVRIKVEPHAYEAVIRHGLLGAAGEQIAEVLPAAKHRRAFVITVASVKRRWGAKLVKSLSAAGFRPALIEMPEGERHKRLATIETLAGKLIAAGADRDSIVIAFGGGVAGDVTGMLASIFMRGIEFVQIPTTLLAQVDASIGGKTGVNLRGGKNLLGTFQQPRIVLIDPAVLATLPEREFRAGLFESLKAGVIGKPQLFEKFEQLSPKQLRSDAELLEWVIAESVRLKADIVARDEREDGLRRVLNFGHTIGHALEADTNYRHFLHGEAVAWGMVAAAKIAKQVGCAEKHVVARIEQAVLRFGPLPVVKSDGKNILKLIQGDKKTRNGVVHFVLPKKIGRVNIVNDVPAQVILRAVREIGQIKSNSCLPQ
ncbi:MAG: 3-dehydroquinate synthase [Acidobacteria bacterium]|nr:MAG: 3-dehydroquinate synthase [Acidobacteriota bacterium]